MEELLQAPTDGVGDAIVAPPILANQFELKIGLLNLVTTIAFHGFENDDPHSHIRRSTKITQTVKLNNVQRDIVKLLLFLFSLEGAARTWLEKEPPNSITTWNDLVSKFIILNKCPHHGVSPLHQIDTFYNSLNQSEQDSLNSAANGNFLTKNTQEALTIIKNKSKVQTSRNKPQVSSASGSSTQDAHVTALTKQVEALLSSMNRPVNSIQNGCETCGGPHAYYECQVTGGYTQDDVYATTGTYNQVHPYPASRPFELPPTPVSSPVIPERNPHQPPIPLHFNIILAEALAHMPKYAKMVKDLLTSKKKLLELVNTPLNKNCSVVLLKKLPKKLRDTRRILIPSTRTVAYPAGIAEDVFVKVGKFTFPANFVVVDYDVDPRVPLILGRPFLRTTHALVDVHGEELTLRVGDEKLVFNVESTSKYPRKHGDESIHKIDILDITCEDYFHKVLNVQKSINLLSGSPTLSSDPVVASLSPSLTPFGD
ncbi:reverse transcriptase domain-containing protein, partial [Tanacetum coccineum]